MRYSRSNRLDKGPKRHKVKDAALMPIVRDDDDLLAARKGTGLGFRKNG